MCLAVPAHITEKKSDQKATVNILGLTRDISLDLLPNAKEGDWVLVHAGFGIEIVDEADALETIELIEQMPVGFEPTEVPEAFRELGYAADAGMGSVEVNNHDTAASEPQSLQPGSQIKSGVTEEAGASHE